ncbi:hypothetical protein CDAR_204001 [Caerostris darwini]|uniref:Uncharacterized protein n=1 Tax=Caerostris darwini TaxID=1538125 RepID=A0AAV4RML9_9ARAC|nr:hypothetical protein CDAR_204001 [Caerostris darwini]
MLPPPFSSTFHYFLISIRDRGRVIRFALVESFEETSEQIDARRIRTAFPSHLHTMEPDGSLLPSSKRRFFAFFLNYLYIEFKRILAADSKFVMTTALFNKHCCVGGIR